MKKLILIIVTFIMGLFSANAQNLNALFEHYEKNKNTDVVEISPTFIKGGVKIIAGLAEFAPNITEEEKESIKLLEGLESVRFVFSKTDTIDFFEDLTAQNFFQKNNYELLLKKTGGEESIHIYALKGEKKMLSNLLYIIKGEDNKGSVLLNITGNINIEKVLKLIVLANRESAN